MTKRLTAVELDAVLTRLAEMLAALTPQERAELRAALPADVLAQADQVLAAQSVGLGLRIAAGDERVLCREVDDWIRLGLLDVLLQWVGGHSRTCMHAPHWRRPQPVFSCAWKPGLVVCIQCVALLKATGIADKTCDCCGHVCAGVEAGDAVWGGSVFIGELCYEFGTCADCRPVFEGAA